MTDMTKQFTEEQRATFLKSAEAALAVLNRKGELDISELKDVLEPLMEFEKISQIYEALASDSDYVYDAICELEEVHNALL